MQNLSRLTIFILSVLLLQACHQPSLKSSAPIQLIGLAEINSYQFKGKMSFSDGQDGGSGSVDWQNSSGYISARLKGPLGSNSWQILESKIVAELVTDDMRIVADSATELISNQLGWEVPWEQLKSWVIGQPYNKRKALINWKENGFSLLEDGWQIEYSRMKTYEGNSTHHLPHKMIARKGPYAIKLSIKKWTW